MSEGAVDDGAGSASAAVSASGGCMVTGCSGQVCADQPVTTTCEWTEAYACYKRHGICERNAAGQCGWRPTAALAACLTRAR